MARDMGDPGNGHLKSYMGESQKAPDLNKKITNYSPKELKDKADNQSAGSWRYPISAED